MKLKIGILLSVLAVNGALADYQGALNRRAIDRTAYHEARAKAEYEMFKSQYKLSKRKHRQAKKKAEVYTAWSKADARLFDQEQRMFKSGIRTTNYSWHGSEEASAQGRIR